jgi:hypothetical protein
MFKQIQVHYVSPNGATGVINYLTGDNVEISQPFKAKFGREQVPSYPARYEALKRKAADIAGQWSRIFPEDRFIVREV